MFGDGMELSDTYLDDGSPRPAEPSILRRGGIPSDNCNIKRKLKVVESFLFSASRALDQACPVCMDGDTRSTCRTKLKELQDMTRMLNTKMENLHRRLLPSRETLFAGLPAHAFVPAHEPIAEPDADFARIFPKCSFKYLHLQ